MSSPMPPWKKAGLCKVARICLTSSPKNVWPTKSLKTFRSSGESCPLLRRVGCMGLGDREASGAGVMGWFIVISLVDDQLAKQSPLVLEHLDDVDYIASGHFEQVKRRDQRFELGLARVAPRI